MEAGTILGLVINILISIWIIPLYLGSKRKIGYTWSMLACLFLTPLIGLIITLLSPRINKLLRPNETYQDRTTTETNQNIDTTDHGEKIQIIFSQLIGFSHSLNDLFILLDHPWVVETNNLNQRIVYIFSSNKELVISTNGSVEIGRWEYYSNANSLLISTNQSQTLYSQIFIDDKVLLLKHDGGDQLTIFVNEKRKEDNFQIETYIQDTYKLALSRESNENEITHTFKIKEQPKSARDILIEEKSVIEERITFSIVVVVLCLFFGIVCLIPVFQQKEQSNVALVCAVCFFIISFLFWILYTRNKRKVSSKLIQLEELKYPPEDLVQHSNLENETSIHIVEESCIKRGYTIKMGFFREYLVRYSNGKRVNVYYKESNGKYFIYSKHEIILFPDKQSCLNYLL